MTRPYTKEEMRKMFLDVCRDTARYWSKVENRTPQEMCDEIVDLVEKWLPEPQNASGSQNVDIELLVDGFNHCLTKIKGKLR